MKLLKVLTICAMTVLLIGVQSSTNRHLAADMRRNPLARGISHIGGSATDVVVQGEFAYVGYAGELAVLDISDVTSPRRIGYVMISANDLAMRESNVYVAGTQGLRIVDVSTPAEPHVIGAYETQNAANGVWVTGKAAYVVTNRGGLHIVNMKDPHHPTRMGFLAIKEHLPDITVAEPYAFVAANNGLQVVDVSNPHQPELAAYLDIPGFAADLALAGDRLFLTNEFQGLSIIDVSDPLLPKELQNVTLNSMVWDVEALGDIAYVASSEPGLYVIDGALPTKPDPVFSLQEPNSLWALFLCNDMLFGVNMDGDLHILDLADPRQPARVGTYDPPGYSVRVAAFGARAYVVADTSSSVYELDAASRAIVAKNLYIAPDFTVAIAATVDGFIASGETTALWAGVKETDNYYRCERFFPAEWSLNEVAVSEDRIYATGRNSGLVWVEDTESKPLRHGTVALEDDVPRTVAVAGRYVYVGGNKGLFVFAHTPHHAPEKIGFVETVGPVDIVRTDGAAGFAIIDSQQFCTMDFTDHKRPTVTGCLVLASPAYGAVLYGDYAYVAVGAAGVSIIDMKDLAQPDLVGQIEMIGYALDIAAADHTIYIAAAAGGLVVLQL